MVDNDIYKSKERYETFVNRADDLALSLEDYRKKHNVTIKQNCIYKGNINYFKRLIEERDNMINEDKIVEMVLKRLVERYLKKKS